MAIASCHNEEFSATLTYELSSRQALSSTFSHPIKAEKLVEGAIFYSSVYFLLLYQRADVHQYIEFFLDLQLYFIVQHVYFNASIMS